MAGAPVGTRIAPAPRTDPSERDYRTGLLPWVSGGKASVWVRVHVPDSGQPTGGQPAELRPRHPRLLAPAYERHHPEPPQLVNEVRDCLEVAGDGVVVEVALRHAP